jgi:hypothetical protein
MKTILPTTSFGKTASTEGISGRVSIRRLLFAPQADDSETNLRKVLLMEKTSIHGDEDAKASFNGSPEQCPVPRASPTQERHGVHFMPFQVAA